MRIAEALLTVLDAKALAGAALDVTSLESLPAAHALFGRRDVLLTPNLDGRTVAVFDADLAWWRAGEEVWNHVDFDRIVLSLSCVRGHINARRRQPSDKDVREQCANETCVRGVRFTRARFDRRRGLVWVALIMQAVVVFCQVFNKDSAMSVRHRVDGSSSHTAICIFVVQLPRRENVAPVWRTNIGSWAGPHHGARRSVQGWCVSCHTTPSPASGRLTSMPVIARRLPRTNTQRGGLTCSMGPIISRPLLFWHCGRMITMFRCGPQVPRGKRRLAVGGERRASDRQASDTTAAQKARRRAA
jgi:hypothetical protein